VPPGPSVPLDAWTRVTLKLVVGPKNVPQSGALLFGSTLVASATMHPGTTDPTLDVELGFSYVAPQNSSWSILYDNATFAAQ
jgi:hypothetical protein